MTSSTFTSVIQLQYCPVCRHLIRPSALNGPDSILKEGVYFHATCLTKGERASARTSPQQDIDFDNEDGAQTDFQNYDKVVVESITAMRTRKPSGPNATAGTGLHSAIRRKTTTSAASSSVRSEEAVPAARRSSMVLRSYSDPRAKKSPALMIGAAAGALVLIAIGAFFLLTSSPPPSSNVTDNRNAEPPRVSVTPQPVTPVPPPRPPDLVNPPSPVTPPVDTAPTPYELAHRDPPPGTPQAVQPAGGAQYQAAGPAVPWLAGDTLGDWKFVHGTPTALVVKDDILEVVPGPAHQLIEHALPMPDFDLTFEYRIGADNQGAYGEIWTPSGVMLFTGADFQSQAWTPVTISVRGGVLTGTHGTKGPGNIHPGTLQPMEVNSDRGKNMAGRQVVMLSFSSVATKSVRNMQYTPMRPVAQVAVVTPPPAVPGASGAAGRLLPLPALFGTDKLDQPLGTWHRGEAKTEGDKKFIAWTSREYGRSTLFFELSDSHQFLPDKLHMHFEYRSHAATGRGVVTRIYMQGNKTSDQTAELGPADTWQVAELDFTGCAGEAYQIELRLGEEPAPETTLDIADLRITAPAMVSAPPPVVPPQTTPVPVPPSTEPAGTALLALSAKEISTPKGAWKNVEQKTDNGQTVLLWTANPPPSRFPYFKFSAKDTVFPATVKAHMVYRVNKFAGSHIAVRIYNTVGPGFCQGMLPVGTQGQWQDAECTIVGLKGIVNQAEIRCVEAEQTGTTIEISSLTLTDASAPAVTTAPPAIPVATTTQLFKLEGAVLEESGGKWNRVTPLVENGITFMRWESAATFLYFANTGNQPFATNMHIKIRARFKNYHQGYLTLHMYSNGVNVPDQDISMGPPDADGWNIAEGDLKNTYTSLREFEIKPAGERDPALVMDIDSIEFTTTAASTKTIPANTPPAGVGPTPPPTLPVTNPAGTGPGVLLFKLEGAIQEKIGRWSRVQEGTEDDRNFVTWSDPTVQHPPPFMTFENPAGRVFPTKIRIHFTYRFNKALGNIRIFLSGHGNEELVATAPTPAADAGKWLEGDYVATVKDGLKDEFYFKLGTYADGFALNIDSLEVYDLTQAAPAALPGGPGTPQGVPPIAPVGGPAQGTRVFGQTATSKKLTAGDTKAWTMPGTTGSISMPGMTAKLFDGDTANGIFSITSTDPKTASCWLIVDLGSEASIDGIKVFNFANADRTYGSQVWQICPYDDFQRSVVTVYNSDTGNVHGQGVGGDPSAKATKEGLQAFFTPVRGRYVRLWFNGNNDNADNHILEVEVFGATGTAGFATPAHLAEGDLKLNAGRGTVGDWKAETGYAATGIDQADAKPVALAKSSLTIPDKLYNTYRGGAQIWNFPKLPDGNYWVRLHFQEPTLTAAGARRFDVLLNDETVLKNYDIFAAAGGPHKAVVETVAAVAMNGKGLKLEFKAVTGAPLVCGVEVLPTDGPIAAPAKQVAP